VTPQNQPARHQLSLITIDQAIAGGSNVLIAVLAARLLDAAGFGLFGLVFLVYVLAQGVSRALVCDPLLIHPAEGEQRKGEVIGTSCMLGVALGAGVALIGLAVTFANTGLGVALAVLGLCLPLLVLQDLGRYLAFATQKPDYALALDIAWLLLLLAAVVPLFVTDTDHLPWLIAAWAGSGALAGVLTLFQHRAATIHLNLAWLRYTWAFSWRYLISYSATQGAALAGASAVGAISGARALGGLQGAVLLVRPYVTFQIAVTTATIGHITRSLSSRGAIRRHVARASMLPAAVAVANLIVLLLLPDTIGHAVLGDTWEVAQPLLLATGVQIVVLGLMTGVRAGLLGMRAIRKVMVIDLATTFLVLGASVVGAEINGALGAIWAITCVQVAVAIAMLFTFLASTPPSGGDAEDEAEAEAEAEVAAEGLPARIATPPPL
jgi:O-antigen/teichoic acid export membrane protein